MLKLGYKASAEQFAPAKLLEFGVLAEQAGFDSCFVSDHFQPWKHTDGHAPNSLVWLGALGARTQRLILGTSVLTPTFRYHPSIIAQAFGTMGAMFPGRVILGIGTGEGLNEVPSTGAPWPEFKERFARMRESVQLMRKLWTEDHVTFEGEFYKTQDATIYDRPDKPVPIYIAAGGPQVANSWPMSAKALNSSALPAGSRKNIVACSPTWPLKRICGAMTKRIPAAVSRSARGCHRSMSSTTPKWGTGTS